MIYDSTRWWPREGLLSAFKFLTVYQLQRDAAGLLNVLVGFVELSSFCRDITYIKWYCVHLLLREQSPSQVEYVCVLKCVFCEWYLTLNQVQLVRPASVSVSLCIFTDEWLRLWTAQPGSVFCCLFLNQLTGLTTITYINSLKIISLYHLHWRFGSCRCLLRNDVVDFCLLVDRVDNFQEMKFVTIIRVDNEEGVSFVGNFQAKVVAYLGSIMGTVAIDHWQRWKVKTGNKDPCSHYVFYSLKIWDISLSWISRSGHWTLHPNLGLSRKIRNIGIW